MHTYYFTSDLFSRSLLDFREKFSTYIFLQHTLLSKTYFQHLQISLTELSFIKINIKD